MNTHTPQLGFWLETESQAACEIAATLGYEAVVLDMEHGVISATAADRLIAFSRPLGLTAYSRVSAAERVPIQQALDAGADGVIIPQIQNAGHARSVTACAKYPPLGVRGIGFNRTMSYGATDADFCDTENRRSGCFPMIETPGALEEAEKIASLETVDGLFLGPGDLSLTRGRGLNRWTSADVADAERVIGCAKKAGKSWAMPAANQTTFAFARKHGASYVTLSDDLSALHAGLAGGWRWPAHKGATDEDHRCRGALSTWTERA